MKSEHSVEIAKGGGWELGVTKEFKQLTKENPDFIPRLYNLIKEIRTKKEGTAIEHRGIVIKLFYKTDRNEVYHVQYEGHEFAVKLALASSDMVQRGFTEFESAQLAEQVIQKDEKLRTLNLRIVPFQLGFSERFSEHNYSFYVSTWYKDDGLDKLIKFTDGSILSDAERDELRSRVKLAFFFLSHKYHFVDLTLENAFYNPKTKEIVLFDLHHTTDVEQ